MKPLKYACLSVALLTLAACGKMGAPEAPLAEEVIKPLSELTTTSNLGGSNTTPVPVNGCANGAGQDVTLTFSVTGKQENLASFKINTQWVYDAGTWTGSAPSQIDVPAQSAGTTTTYKRVVTLKNGSTNSSGSSQVIVKPFDESTSGQAKLNFTNGSSTIHVSFTACTPTPPPNTAPSLTLPNNITAEATSAAGAVVTYLATADDAEDGNGLNATCSPASGSTFPLGATTVKCSYTDAGGLTASDSFTVTVVDTTAPVISGMPSNQTLEATGASGAVATWTAPTANDLVDGSVAVNCDAASGDTFALGTKTVTCTATDSRNNSATSSFTITVQDTTPPVITWGDSTIYGGSFYFGSVPAAPTCSASDLVSGNVTCTVTGYSTAVGSHTLTATATDGAGNKATGTRSYTVLAWTLKGFYSPVDMGGVVNTVKAGSTVPLKFEIFAGLTEQTSTSAISSFTTAVVNCSTLGSIADEIEVTTTGGTSLRYDSTAGQFIQNWQTPKTVGTCYTAKMTAQDGSFLTAFLKTR